jgi:glycosyltransferase involved in cell wall biosynthesis
MRLAFVDLLFSWPPHGGADVDLYHVIVHLQHAGHEVRLFGVRDTASWERGAFAPEALPFPAERLDFSPRQFTRAAVTRRVRQAVDAWKPEAVFVCDGFFLKPHVIQALAHYPTYARYYAYEMACHRDILRFKQGAPCPNAYLQTPDVCRRCALAHLAPSLRRGQHDAWRQEYLAAGAHRARYHGEVRAALGTLRGAIVYNEAMAGLLRPVCPEVVVVPGGVNANQFTFAPPPPRAAGAPKVILMAGRAEDPAKGVDTLRRAGEILRAKRSDFEIWATLPEDTPASDWFKPIGWHSAEALRMRYREADICVVPSLWDEPFGLVALEAMATGRPVCASQVGGLQTIVSDRQTGFLFPRGDAGELAAALSLLLDNAELRARMGEAGRRHVEAHYTWSEVVGRHYAPILARLAERRAS